MKSSGNNSSFVDIILVISYVLVIEFLLNYPCKIKPNFLYYLFFSFLGFVLFVFFRNRSRIFKGKNKIYLIFKIVYICYVLYFICYKYSGENLELNIILMLIFGTNIFMLILRGGKVNEK